MFFFENLCHEGLDRNLSLAPCIEWSLNRELVLVSIDPVIDRLAMGDFCRNPVYIVRLKRGRDVCIRWLWLWL